MYFVFNQKSVLENLGIKMYALKNACIRGGGRGGIIVRIKMQLEYHT